jgi:hypothetical protein
VLARAASRWPRQEIPPLSSDCVMEEKPKFSQEPRHELVARMAITPNHWVEADAADRAYHPKR